MEKDSCGLRRCISWSRFTCRSGRPLCPRRKTGQFDPWPSFHFVGLPHKKISESPEVKRKNHEKQKPFFSFWNSFRCLGPFKRSTAVGKSNLIASEPILGTKLQPVPWLQSNVYFFWCFRAVQMHIRICPVDIWKGIYIKSPSFLSFWVGHLIVLMHEKSFYLNKGPFPFILLCLHPNIVLIWNIYGRKPRKLRHGMAELGWSLRHAYDAQNGFCIQTEAKGRVNVGRQSPHPPFHECFLLFGGSPIFLQLNWNNGGFCLPSNNIWKEAKSSFVRLWKYERVWKPVIL